MTSLVTDSGEAETPPWIKPIGEETLQQIAKGLCQYESQILKNPAVYPPQLQLGVDKIALTCLIEKIPNPIQGVPDFLSRWAQLPLKNWGFNIDFPTEEWHDKQLIEHQKPSDFCIEIAADYSEEGGKFQNQVINEVMLKSAEDHDLYTRFRRYLIENPVITNGKLSVDRILDFKEVQKILRISYEEAPESYRVDGKFYCCGHCGGLMYLTDKDELKCENKHCEQQKKAKVVFPADKDEEVFWLKKDLRYFIHRPGKAELRLEEKLKELNLQVQLYPELDKYDLHLVFPDQTIWAVDVKFWESAYNLAKKVNQPIRSLKHQPYHQAFFVFPDEIKSYGQEYLQEFRSYCSISLNKSQVMFEGEFMKKVINKLGSQK
ncbi:hypothetical protein [Floridanema aerugineum]|uniref:REase associating with pPIWI RE domain-containing protein n=1 Tax=Floridaenema aerugineum BLCC-F46 TaxID=3153654 RepID=A0ABV4XAU6_9CYAN